MTWVTVETSKIMTEVKKTPPKPCIPVNNKVVFHGEIG